MPEHRYEELLDIARQAHLIGGATAILEWDQEVYMPDGGLEFRSRQLSLLASREHALLTDPRVGDLLAACEDDVALVEDPLSVSAVNIRELRRIFDRRTRLPRSLVEEEAVLASRGQHAWREARAASDFNAFAPTLEKIIDLLRRKAECYGWAEDGEPWDALAEDYEPGCTAADMEKVFTPLRSSLQALLQDLMGSSSSPPDDFNTRALPIEKQSAFVHYICAQIGFDFNRGRLDVATHPFCSGTHSSDVRLTTRFHENNVNDALGSTMHEAGHGIYEQGLLLEHTGTPMGEYVSLGIHESQSRLWENQVGRSHAFWQWCHPKLEEFFGDAVSDLDLETVYGGANIVKPDCIRVEADEATYNMHIMIRFDIERRLLRGDLAVEDLPGVWDESYEEFLGVTVPDAARGCLQDIHWSMTSMGYFPTYTLGNLYAAQFFEQAVEDMPDLHEQFAAGSFEGRRTWLNTTLHAHGRRYRAGDLCREVTGKPLSAEPLLRHLEGKLRPLYGLD